MAGDAAGALSPELFVIVLRVASIMTVLSAAGEHAGLAEWSPPGMNDTMCWGGQRVAEAPDMMPSQSSKIEMVEVTDPVENAKAQRQRVQFDRNSAWLQAHIPEVYTTENRGKCICIAGQELFVADNVEEAVAQATAAHPDDEGWFTRYIPETKAVMIYAV